MHFGGKVKGKGCEIGKEDEIYSSSVQFGKIEEHDLYLSKEIPFCVATPINNSYSLLISFPRLLVQ